ncbi:KRAB domain-containing zinc finger protein [Sarotherodon galilaeus]
MSPKPAKSNGKTTECAAASVPANVSKADITALLAEHRSALLVELKVSFFDDVNKKLDGLQKVSDNHGERLESFEESAETLDQRLAKVEDTCETLRVANEKLKAKLSDMESRNRRCNACLIGLEEGIEGPQPSKFFSQLLQDVFGRDIFPSPPELDRAHRISAPKPAPGGRPRPVIVCFHRYQNKELLIWEARRRNDLKYMDKPFRVYEDYNPEVVSQRREYRSVMSRLYEMGLKSSLLYPARLRIVKTDGVRLTFGSVAEAERFLRDSMED